MLIRVVALVALLASLVACTPDSDAALPAARTPVTGAVPSDVPAARWHAVLIAGDNNSPSFDNGIDALRDKLAARGVLDIRLLTSDPQRNPWALVATAANVSSALRNAGGAGACLAFITSHGNETGVVLRQANGVIRPGNLDNALDVGCGSLPTVLIVSACHSGIFLTPGMRQPNRVVLTAAAADRASFGCGTGSTFAYYDQCLLQQFDAAATWGQLAEATRTCVQNLETRLGVPTPSMPQIFVGSAVTNLKLPGR
jgi:hypothetical protein